MNKDIYISILVPVYNVELYLDEFLKSVEKQTIINNMELICINDGSTDSSPTILQKYINKIPNMIILNKKNSGVGSARNFALELFKGEYVLCLDSDDYILEKDSLKKLYDIAKLNSLDILAFNHCTLKKNVITKHYLKRKEKKIYKGKEYLSEKQGNGITNTLWDKIYRGEYLKKIEFRFLEGIIYEDAEALIRLFYEADRVSYYNIYAYCYRIRDNSIMTKDKTLKNINSVELILKTYSFHYELEKDKKFKKYLKALIFNNLQFLYELILEKKEFATKFEVYNYYKLKYFNNLEQFFISNEEVYIKKYLRKRSIKRKFNLNYIVRKIRRKYFGN